MQIIIDIKQHPVRARTRRSSAVYRHRTISRPKWWSRPNWAPPADRWRWKTETLYTLRVGKECVCMFVLTSTKFTCHKQGLRKEHQNETRICFFFRKFVCLKVLTELQDVYYGLTTSAHSAAYTTLPAEACCVSGWKSLSPDAMLFLGRESASPIVCRSSQNTDMAWGCNCTRTPTVIIHCHLSNVPVRQTSLLLPPWECATNSSKNPKELVFFLFCCSVLSDRMSVCGSFQQPRSGHNLARAIQTSTVDFSCG